MAARKKPFFLWGTLAGVAVLMVITVSVIMQAGGWFKQPICETVTKNGGTAQIVVKQDAPGVHMCLYKGDPVPSGYTAFPGGGEPQYTNDVAWVTYVKAEKEPQLTAKQ